MYILNTQQMLFTRFNFPLFNKTYLDSEWVKYRLELFKDICLPSVMNQRNSNFDWFITINDESPESVINYFKELNKDQPWIKPSFQSIRRSNKLKNKLGTVNSLKIIWREITDPYINKDTEYIITTKLDSDDSIHYDYMSNVLSQCQERKNLLIVFTDGVWRMINKDVGTMQSDKYNAFQSVQSKITRDGDNISYRHVCGWGSHKQAHRSIPTVNVSTDDPMWLVTIHDTNDSSRMRSGKRFTNLKDYFNYER